MNERQVITLASAELKRPYVVLEVVETPGRADWRQRLEELGFLPGEPVTVLARAAPGGDPLAVRVGLSTYALRRAEAACVRVAQPDGAAP